MQLAGPLTHRYHVTITKQPGPDVANVGKK